MASTQRIGHWTMSRLFLLRTSTSRICRLRRVITRKSDPSLISSPPASRAPSFWLLLRNRDGDVAELHPPGVTPLNIEGTRFALVRIGGPASDAFDLLPICGRYTVVDDSDR